MRFSWKVKKTNERVMDKAGLKRTLMETLLEKESGNTGPLGYIVQTKQ